MTIQVPDDSVDFVEEFVERIGGSVEEKKVIEEKLNKVKKVKAVKKKNRLILLEHGLILILILKHIVRNYGEKFRSFS